MIDGIRAIATESHISRSDTEMLQVSGKVTPASERVSTRELQLLVSANWRSGIIDLLRNMGEQIRQARRAPATKDGSANSHIEVQVRHYVLPDPIGVIFRVLGTSDEPLFFCVPAGDHDGA